MTGWIKINRKIIEHWLWQDAERLKWWLDLLFMASWEERKTTHDAHLITLQRGQMVASIGYLKDRWGKNHQTILKFLKTLENEGMITRKVLYRQTAIITICNYDSYQSGFAPSNIQLTYNQHTTNIQCESVQQALVFAPKSDQPNLDVNNCGIMGYINNNPQTNTQLTYNQHTANMQSTHDQQTDNIQVTTYKNIRNKEIKKNISSTSARAREVENFEVLDGKEEKENQQKKARKESFLELLEKDELWLGAIARKFSLARVELVKCRLEDFDLDMICRGKTTHTDIQDYKSHFVDWLYKNNSATPKSNNQYGVSKQDKQTGSRFVPKSSEGEVYTQSF